jgi:hypothetical protein
VLISLGDAEQAEPFLERARRNFALSQALDDALRSRGRNGAALRRIADGKSRRSEQRLQRLSELLLPIVVIAMGIFVLLQAMSIFLLLTESVQGLA